MASIINPVFLESVEECKIEEITLGGDELYIQPETMSESLTTLAGKVDFSENSKQCQNDSNGSDSSDDEDEEDEDNDFGGICAAGGKPTQQLKQGNETKKKRDDAEKSAHLDAELFAKSQWPWDSVRNKLKHSLTEMCVLQDLLKLAKRKQYLAIDNVAAEKPENKKRIHVIAKKKSLAMAATILTSGQERIRKSLELVSKLPDFHKELQTLRKNWRLKKAGNSILGDLTYKSAGSRFNGSGSFEVVKTLHDNIDNIDPADCPLTITVPSDLQGLMFIQVSIISISEEINLSNIGYNQSYRPLPKHSHWQKQLEAAQNILFCRELFLKISQEAQQVDARICNIVLDNQILISLFPGYQLSIALRHFQDNKNRPDKPIESISSSDTDHVLEHSLHQLLRRQHYRESKHAFPHPSTGALGLADKVHYITSAFNAYEINLGKENESILTEITQQAQHLIIRKEILSILDCMSLKMKEPLIAVHCICNNTAKNSRVNVNITANGYEMLHVTTISIDIGHEYIYCHSKLGQHIEMCFDPHTFRNFILEQISKHHLAVIRSLTKLLNWTVLCYSPSIGVGRFEAIMCSQSIKIMSMNGLVTLDIISGPVSGIKVYVNFTKDETDDIQLIDFNKILGFNFIDKLETVMSILDD